MSATKRLLDEIKHHANELKAQHSDRAWYACLDEATLEVTKNECHFKDVHPQFAIDLLHSPKDLNIALKREAKQLVKTKGIKHSEARQHIAMQWGFDDYQQVEAQNDAYRSYTRDPDKYLKAGDPELVVINTADEWLALPMLDDALDVDKPSKWIRQLDYVEVPLKACHKRDIDTNLSQEGVVLLPYARLVEPLSPDLPVKAIRLPETTMPSVMKWIHCELINDFDDPDGREYKLFVKVDINPEVLVQTYVPTDKMPDRLRPYRLLRLLPSQSPEICSECSLPIDECICTYPI